MSKVYNPITESDRIQIAILETLEEIREIIKRNNDQVKVEIAPVNYQDKIENNTEEVETVDKIDENTTIIESIVIEPVVIESTTVKLDKDIVDKIEEELKCEKCGKVCKSKLGLNSHSRSCKGG